jgi:hypothetical protein
MGSIRPALYTHTRRKHSNDDEEVDGGGFGSPMERKVRTRRANTPHSLPTTEPQVALPPPSAFDVLPPIQGSMAAHYPGSLPRPLRARNDLRACALWRDRDGHVRLRMVRWTKSSKTDIFATMTVIAQIPRNAIHNPGPRYATPGQGQPAAAHHHQPSNCPSPSLSTLRP